MISSIPWESNFRGASPVSSLQKIKITKVVQLVFPSEKIAFQTYFVHLGCKKDNLMVVDFTRINVVCGNYLENCILKTHWEYFHQISIGDIRV